MYRIRYYDASKYNKKSEENDFYYGVQSGYGLRVTSCGLLVRDNLFKIQET